MNIEHEKYDTSMNCPHFFGQWDIKNFTAWKLLGVKISSHSTKKIKKIIQSTFKYSKVDSQGWEGKMSCIDNSFLGPGISGPVASHVALLGWSGLFVASLKLNHLKSKSTNCLKPHKTCNLLPSTRLGHMQAKSSL